MIQISAGAEHLLPGGIWSLRSRPGLPMIPGNLFHAFVEVLKLLMQLHREDHDNVRPYCRSTQAILHCSRGDGLRSAPVLHWSSVILSAADQAGLCKAQSTRQSHLPSGR